MADIVSRDVRSRMMAGISGKNTKPEIIVRKSLHRRGFRFSLHKKELQGKPDLVLPKYKTVIFVHGCFWHGHDCHLFKWPKSNENFWKEKINGNKVRDNKNVESLLAKNWHVIKVWECALRQRPQEDVDTTMDSIASALLKNREQNLHYEAIDIRY